MSATTRRRVSEVFVFANGMTAVFGDDGRQIPELQGPWSDELRKKIEAAADDETEWLVHKSQDPKQ